MIPVLKSNFLNFALVNKYTVYVNNFIVHSIKLVIGVLMSERCVLFYKMTCICQFWVDQNFHLLRTSQQFPSAATATAFIYELPSALFFHRPPSQVHGPVSFLPREHRLGPTCLDDVLVTNIENVTDSSTPWCNNLTTLNVKCSSTGDRLFPRVALRQEINSFKN